MFAAQVKGFFTDLPYCHAIGKNANGLKGDAFVRGQGLVHGVTVEGFDTNNPNLRCQGLEVGSYAGNQATTTHRYKNRVELAGALAQDLISHGSLPGNNQFIIKGMDKGQAALLLQLFAVFSGFRIIIAMQNNLGAKSFDRIDFDLWSGYRHHDQSLDAELFS